MRDSTREIPEASGYGFTKEYKVYYFSCYDVKFFFWRDSRDTIHRKEE